MGAQISIFFSPTILSDDATTPAPAASSAVIHKVVPLSARFRGSAL
jgi:hypothetical protein